RSCRLGRWLSGKVTVHNWKDPSPEPQNPLKTTVPSVITVGKVTVHNWKDLSPDPQNPLKTTVPSVITVASVQHFLLTIALLEGLADPYGIKSFLAEYAVLASKTDHIPAGASPSPFA
ncbi:hypothetical protein STEG23_004257, partial [Scotinomys teguina]